MENHGAGLQRLNSDQLTKLLVSTPNLRIVDENGTVLPDLNARGRFANRPGADGNHRPVMVRPEGADTRMPVREEYTVRPDGRMSRSVSWQPDGSTTGHVRRPVHSADPLRETPEMAGGVGLGGAAVMELPGAERIHTEVRALVKGLMDAKHSWLPGRSDHADHAAGSGHAGDAFPGGDQPGARSDRMSVHERMKLDKNLQLQFSVPKLRAARDRGFDAGLRDQFTIGGRRYDVTVSQELHGRDGSTEIHTEPNIAIDHQVKGSRGGSQNVTRKWSIGGEAAVGTRQEIGPLSLEIGEFGLSGERSRSDHMAVGDSTKNQTRVRGGGKVDSSRPDYPASYHVTVTETRRTLTGYSSRKVSRVLAGSDVHVPAVVHPAFRPDPDVARSEEFQNAFRDVAQTVGRTTELDRQEFENLLKPAAGHIDFSKTGYDGMHATFTGLHDTVKALTELAVSHAQDGKSRGTDDPHPRYVAEVEKAITEGFLRSNLEHLLSPPGFPIPMPKEHNSLHSNVDSVLTIRGHLVRSDDAAGFEAKDASVESYREYDTKISRDRTDTTSIGVLGSIGPMAKFKLPHGEHQTENEQTTSASRRAITPRVTATVDADVKWNLKSTTQAKTIGSIDVTLLSEAGGQHVVRAHLVLDVTSIRQPTDVPLHSRAADVFTGRPGASSAPSERTVRLLVENSAEVYMSRTLHQDLADAGGKSSDQPPAGGKEKFLQPPDREDRPFHITRDEAAFASGYPTHFDDTKAAFHGHGPAGDIRVPAGNGIIGAIHQSLTQSKLVDPEHLAVTSDIWRSIEGKFNPAELKAHPHDLLGVGMTHRVEVPKWPGSTRRVTISVKAEAQGFEHIRTRDRGQVHIGGQALEQTSDSRTSAVTTKIGASTTGMYTNDGHNYGAAEAGANWEHESSNETGEVIVARDIRRAAVVGLSENSRTAGEGEEFANGLKVRVEIHADVELPEPFRRAQEFGVSDQKHQPVVWLETSPGRENLVTMRSVIPRHFAEPGPPPKPAAARPAQPVPTGGRSTPRPGPVAGASSRPGTVPVGGDSSNSRPGPAPRVSVTLAPRSEARPGMLEAELGRNMQGLSFPDLAHVADWAPSANLSRGDVEKFTGRDGGPMPPRLANYAPTSDRSVFLNSSLSNRNVRNNVEQVFRHEFPLPANGRDPLLMGVRVGVIRPVGEPGRYDGMTFKEQADEPTFLHDTSTSWSGTVNAGGGAGHFLLAPDIGNPGVERASMAEGDSGDYVEFNRTYGGMSHVYGGDVSYFVKGPHDFAVKVDASGQFHGLIHETRAAQAAEKFPGQVVHPKAHLIPPDGATRTTVTGQLVNDVSTPPTKEDPLRLFADLTDPADRAGFLDTARDLSTRVRGPVDIALVHYANGRTDHLEHFLFDPADGRHTIGGGHVEGDGGIGGGTDVGEGSWTASEEAARAAADAVAEAARADSNPLGHEALMDQHKLPNFPDTLVFAPPGTHHGGTYTFGDRTVSIPDLSRQITTILTENGTVPPRHVILDSPNSSDLARTLSTDLAQHSVTVIGTVGAPRGVREILPNLGDRTRTLVTDLLAGPTPETGWRAYSGGRPVNVGSPTAHRDIRVLVRTLTAPKFVAAPDAPAGGTTVAAPVPGTSQRPGGDTTVMPPVPTAETVAKPGAAEGPGGSGGAEPAVPHAVEEVPQVEEPKVTPQATTSQVPETPHEQSPGTPPPAKTQLADGGASREGSTTTTELPPQQTLTASPTPTPTPTPTSISISTAPTHMEQSPQTVVEPPREPPVLEPQQHEQPQMTRPQVPETPQREKPRETPPSTETRPADDGASRKHSTTTTDLPAQQTPTASPTPTPTAPPHVEQLPQTVVAPPHVEPPVVEPPQHEQPRETPHQSPETPQRVQPRATLPPVEPQQPAEGGSPTNPATTEPPLPQALTAVPTLTPIPTPTPVPTTRPRVEESQQIEQSPVEQSHVVVPSPQTHSAARPPASAMPVQTPTGNYWFTTRSAQPDGSTATFRVSDTGWIELSGGMSLAPGGWVGQGDGFVHSPDGVRLSRQGRITLPAGDDTAGGGLDTVSYDLGADMLGVRFTPSGGGDPVVISMLFEDTAPSPGGTPGTASGS
jgi:hypothetical protein